MKKELNFDTKMEVEVSTPYGNIELKTFMDNNFYDQRTLIAKKLINMQDEAVRNALIALGWTPPKDTK